MNGTTTRARTGRPTASPRYDGRNRTYVDGANALAIDYLDEDLVQDLTPPTIEPKRKPRTRAVEAPIEAPVTPPLPITLPRAPFLVLMVTLVVLGVAGVLVLNTRINENAFRLDALRNQQATLDLKEQQLRQNLAELESPGNLRAAAARLGLVPAGTPAFISLPDGRVVGVPQPATGSPSNSATGR